MIDFSSHHNVWIRNEDGTVQPMDEPYFQAEQIAPGAWRILSDGDYSYLLEGDDEALAIDSGYGCGNIREFCQSLTSRPVRRIANTHDHFDHTANNSYFERAYMSAATRELATRPFPSFAGIVSAISKCRFLQGSIQVLYSLIHHITCRFEARQALIYQLVSGLTGENGKYNYSKVVHLYPPFFDIFCSPKNYKTASALTFLQPAGVRPDRRDDRHAQRQPLWLQGEGDLRLGEL